MKIVVIGPTCSGKSSLARQLSKELDLTHIELDDLHWLPDWQVRPVPDFKQLVSEQVEQNPRWVTCGNYSTIREETWPLATHIIWLDYPFSLVLFRSIKRIFRRLVLKEPCCNGNIETAGQVFSRDSMVVWLFRTYWKRKKEYATLLKNYSQANVIHLTHKGESVALSERLK